AVTTLTRPAAAQAPSAENPILPGPYAPKAGPWELNFKLGPAIAVQSGGALGAFELDLGYALNAARTFYIPFGAQGQVIDAPLALLLFQPGVQYDYPLRVVSPNFYVYGSFSGGYVLGVVSVGRIGTFGGGTFNGSGGAITPGAGFKYVHRGKLVFGLDL